MTQASPPPRTPNRPSSSSDLKWLPLLLLPVLCCALPAVLVALAAASAAALGAGIAVVVLLGLTAAVLFMRYRRRVRAEPRQPDTNRERRPRP